MCTPLPGLRAGRAAARSSRACRARRATSRTTSLSTTRGPRSRSPRRRATGISNWCGAYSAKNALGLDARLHQRAHHARGERLGAPLRLERERQRRRRRRSSSWNSCSKLATSARPSSRSSSRRRVAQEAPRAALPRLAVGLDDVAQHELQRALAAVRLDQHAGVGVGQQAQVAGRAERVGLGERAERRERVVGGHPADAARRCSSSSAANTERPRTIEPRSQQTSATSSRRAHLEHLAASRVPLSHMPSAEPERLGARAHARRRPRRRRRRSCRRRGISRRSQRRREALLRLQVDAAVAERGVGVGHAVQAAARARARGRRRRRSARRPSPAAGRPGSPSNR